MEKSTILSRNGKEETHKQLKALAALTPSQLFKDTDLNTFKELGDRASYQDIVSIFKTYRPLDKGNTKLHGSILSFSTLPVITCKRRCKGCYDVKSLRYQSVRIKRIVNTVLAVSCHSEQLFRDISKQVNNSRSCKAVRIHVGGDFFSAEYATQWALFATKTKKVVYTYTKSKHTTTLQAAGINVVKSILDDGSFNFGTLPVIKAKQISIPGSVVCPATMRNVPDHYCGDKCKACQETENVLFVIH